MFWVELLLVWVFGSASHFFYQWSGRRRAVGLFFASNESVWEHGKLGFWPLLGVLLWQGVHAGAGWTAVCCAAVAATLFCAIHTAGLFYAYTGALGIWSVLWADISIFLFSSGLGLWAGWRVLARPCPVWLGAVAALVLALEVFALLWCTCHPPRLPLFTDYSGAKGGGKTK